MTESTRMIARRHLLGLLGAGVGGVLMAACGGAPAPTAAPTAAPKAAEPTAAAKPADAAKPAATTAPAAPAAATAAPAPTTAAAAKPAASTGAPVKISLWWFDRATINNMTKEVIRAEFMAKNPNITVEEQLIPGGQMLTKLNTSIQSKNPPDVIYIDETYLPDLFSQKALHAIPPEVFNVEKEMGPFTAFAMKLPDGKYYALPMGWFGRSLFYNADLLKQLGYAPKDIPTTWTELIRWAKDLTKWEGEKVVQTGHALAGLSGQLVQDGAFVQMGGWRWQTRKQHGFDTPEFRAARKLVADMYDTHKLDSRKGVDSQEFFGQGKAVTMLMQGFYMGFLKTQFPNMQWGTLPKPTFTGQPPYGVYEPDVGWAVTTSRTDPAVLDASWKLWTFMQGPDYMRRYCRFRGVHPSILSVQQEKQFTEEDVEWRGVALKAKPGNFTSEGYYAPQIAAVSTDNYTTFINENRPLEESVKALAADSAKAAQGYCCNYTILSKEEFQQNPAWSGGKIPIPVAIPAEYQSSLVTAERWLPKDALARVVLLLTLVFMVLVIWIPIADTFWLSLHDAFFLKREWAGLSNYQQLWEDAGFWKSLRVSFVYALMVAPTTIVLSLLLAVLVNAVRNVALRSALMGFYFFAFIVPLVAVAIFWLFLLQPNEIGLINAVFSRLGLPQLTWLRHSNTALLSLAIVGIWRHVGYAMVLFVAGIQAIPAVFDEAAAVDGANAWQRLWHITIPLLMPTTAFITIIMTLSSLMMFTEVFVMTNPKGGPGGETTTVVFNIYEQAFMNHREGYASAIASVFFVIIVAIGYLQFRYLRARFEY